MFVKISKVSGVEYVTLVESKWDKVKKKAVHKVVQRLGKKEDLIANDPLAIEKLKEKCKKSKAKISEANQLVSDVMDSLIHNVLLADNETLETKCYGNLIYKKIFNTLKLDKFFNKMNKNYQTKYSLVDIVEFLITSISLRPNESFKILNLNEKYLANYNFPLDSIYRSLRKIAKEKTNLISHLNKQLSRLSINDLSDYYDEITIYFKSISVNDLRNYKLSYDLEPDQTQIVLGLAVDNKGIPINFEVFWENTNKFKTFLPFLKRLKKNFNFKNSTIIFDNDINSKTNLLEMKKLDYNYIITEKINFPDEHISNTFDLNTFEEVIDNFWVKRIPVIDSINNNTKDYSLEEDIILIYSYDRIECDLNNVKKLKSNNLNNQKQNNDNFKTIGFYGIRTNIKEDKLIKTIKQIKELWNIEEYLRLLFTKFETKSTYDWKQEYMLGYFIIWYIALFIQRYLVSSLSETLNFEKNDKYFDASKVMKILNEKATVIVWKENK
ncbi:hypothetical protein GE118_01945 [Mycoplasma sp. NEAQ87857]|uniref:IS1634 family transposase n=1 Tax=Mycoplasma sp. NEAQ87857 TaxID=2683967 RepID=UPI0013186F2E|nr:hypothetical protein [Mycoplasma sp. NEAQ87857]QGZ97557.1 hypothetical protein GE118_01945 [Mycoplasma sp. NEAQ87857]